MNLSLPSPTALLLTLLPLGAAPLSAQDSGIDHLEQRLEYLAQDYEAALEDHNIPGMAVAVVLDDEVIFARGFGLADLESGRQVTPDTGFAIGSTTKAFASVLIGMLVDEGRMEWDAPVTEYLPFFELQLESDHDDAQATIRDLLCHRTGFTRMGMLWAAGQVSQEEILRTATKAKSWDGFRKNFHYNNVMYLAAGEASARVADMTWGELLTERIFKPLRMSTSDHSTHQATKNPKMALGYSWLPDLKQHKREQMRNLDAIAPAGAINSNVLEMSNWLRMLLAYGEFEGERLISEEALMETWQPNIQVGGPVEYGMGWMMTQYDGMQALHHGGNIDGFAAAVALLPEAGMGYVMLTNISHTPLQAPTSSMVWDALLKDFEERKPKQPAEPGAFDEFLGVFMANFGTFSDAEFTVSAKDGALYVDIPGQLNAELLPPDKDQKRGLKVSPTAKFRFVQGEDGEVNLLEFHQGGATFELLRKGHEPELDLPMSELEGYLGQYTDEAFPQPLEVKIQNGHLAIDVPGQMVFELHVPDDEDKWVFRAVPSISVSFELDEAGRALALTRYQGGTETRCERIQSEDKGKRELPNLAELDELRNLKSHLAARAKLGTLRRKSTINFLHSGVSGTSEETMTLDGRFLQQLDLGKFGKSLSGFDGKTGWSDSSFDEYDEPEGRMLDQLLLTPNWVYFGDWRKSFDKVRTLRASALDGVDHWVVQLTKGKLPPITVYINKETGDLTRFEAATFSASGVSVAVTTHMDDYREVHGLRLPFLVRSENDSSGTTLIEMQALEPNLEVEDQAFKPRR